MNFKDDYKEEIKSITAHQRGAGYSDYKINAYLADMEEWVNQHHLRNSTSGAKLIVGAGLAQDNSRYDMPNYLEVVGIQARFFDVPNQELGMWVDHDACHKQHFIDNGWEVYAFKV